GGKHLFISIFSIHTFSRATVNCFRQHVQRQLQLPLDTDCFGLTCIYGLIFSVSLPSNLLSLWGLHHLGRSRGGGCQLVYILNLLLSDLLQLLTLPLWILYLRGGHRWPYGQLTCELVGYVFHVNVYASVMFLCLIARDRCLAIVHPLSSRRVRTVRVAAVMGVAVWSLTFLFCLCGLLPSVFDTDSLLCLEKYPVTSRFARFKIATVVLGFMLPCAILGASGLHPKRTDRGVPCGLERSIFLVYRLCYGLTSLNTMLDPLFYIFLCADARLELQRSLPCLRRGVSTRKINYQSCDSV
uniref:Si:dkey-165a24.9 n=1 Tax=Neogobius melanostomus TaxID=47308 RepID=A0A8C6SYA4_9GOBI